MKDDPNIWLFRNNESLLIKQRQISIVPEKSKSQIGTQVERIYSLLKIAAVRNDKGKFEQIYFRKNPDIENESALIIDRTLPNYICTVQEQAAFYSKRKYRDQMMTVFKIGKKKFAGYGTVSQFSSSGSTVSP